MATVKFLLYENLTGDLGAIYYTELTGNQSGEYVSLADYRHDLANKEQELIAAQEEIRRLRGALKPFAIVGELSNFPKNTDVTLWQRSSNIPEIPSIEIKLSDCQKAAQILND